MGAFQVKFVYTYTISVLSEIIVTVYVRRWATLFGSITRFGTQRVPPTKQLCVLHVSSIFSPLLPCPPLLRSLQTSIPALP